MLNQSHTCYVSAMFLRTFLKNTFYLKINRPNTQTEKGSDLQHFHQTKVIPVICIA